MARTSFPRTLYMGVDPGNDGGMSLIGADGNPLHYDRIRDLDNIREFFRAVDWSVRSHAGATVICAYEEYTGDQAAHSARSGGRYVGIFETFCFLHSIVFIRVSPQTWKGHHGLIIKQPKGQPKMSDKERYEESKRRSMAKVKEAFPDVNLVFPRCKVEHEGVAESLLIALYVKETFVS